MSDLLDKAIDEFENESSDKTLGERISGLRRALMWNAMRVIKNIKKNGKEGAPSDDDEWKHVEYMKQFKVIESMYTSEVKMGKLTGKPEAAIENDFMKRIKEEKGAIGDIVQTSL